MLVVLSVVFGIIIGWRGSSMRATMSVAALVETMVSTIVVEVLGLESCWH